MAEQHDAREAFESWARSIGKTDRDLQRGGWGGKGEYTWRTEAQMFQAFQAGRATPPAEPARTIDKAELKRLVSLVFGEEFQITRTQPERVWLTDEQIEEIEAVNACLGDDAAQLRQTNPEDERADNMDLAATLLEMAHGIGTSPPSTPVPVLDVRVTDTHGTVYAAKAEPTGTEPTRWAIVLPQAEPAGKRQITAFMMDSRGVFMDFSDGTREFYENEIDHEIEDDCPIPEPASSQLCTSEIKGPPPQAAPWPDTQGNSIYHGDTLRHPFSGAEFVAVHLNGYDNPGDAWRAVYRDASVGRLCLQIGDKGQAVVVQSPWLPALQTSTTKC